MCLGHKRPDWVKHEMCSGVKNVMQRTAAEIGSEEDTLRNASVPEESTPPDPQVAERDGGTREKGRQVKRGARREGMETRGEEKETMEKIEEKREKARWGRKGELRKE